MTTILTNLQNILLDALCKESKSLGYFYWTGGTVLSEFYLKHRLSEDIDLFSEQEVDVPSVNSLVTKLKKDTGGVAIKYSNYFGLHT